MKKSNLRLTKVLLLTFTFALALLMLGYHFGGRLGLFVGLVLSVGMHLLILLFGDLKLRKEWLARPLSGRDPEGLSEKTESFAKQLGIPTPQIYISEVLTPTVFSCNRLWGPDYLVISRPALSLLRPEELESVVANQISRLSMGSGFGSTLAQVLANTFMGLAETLDRGLTLAWLKKTPRKKKIMGHLMAPLSWLAIRLAVSKKSYFESDSLTVTLTKNRLALAEALWRLENYHQAMPLGSLPAGSVHLFMVNPLGFQERNWFLLTHPKIDIRIKRLVGYYPV